MSKIDEWVNPYYLREDVVENIRESIKAKPEIKYTVLDNFFVEEKLDQLIDHHQHLSFSEAQDRVEPHTKKVLPYDGAVVFAREGQHFGSDLFHNPEWHRYVCYLTGVKLDHPVGTEIKLRWHRPEADGFWIHTDATIRSLVLICYFNKGWKTADGGLLQLWRVDEELSPEAPKVNNPQGRLDVLESKRINTRSPGGGFPDGRDRDLVLIDQVVPVYNRVFLCNFQAELAYHSVTPSNGKARQGFVQWMFPDRGY
jgi:hypothetical protein